MGWFGKPKAPLSDQNREWIDAGAKWILEEFGESVRTRPVVLPSTEFFPDPWDESDEALEALVRRVCGYMEIDRSRFRLELFSDSDDWVGKLLPAYEGSHQGAAGLYIDADDGEKFVLALEESKLDDAAGVVATMAHELCHIHLIGDRRVDPEKDDDHEFLTDLLTVFLGLGVFTANSAFQFKQWEDGQKIGWSASRSGYLPEEEFGYALALHAWLRGERKPAWAGYLTENIAHFFKKSARFLAHSPPAL